MQGIRETLVCESGPKSNRFWCLLVLFSLLVLPIYANTIKAGWQFDDRPNIVHKEVLHLKTVDLDSVQQVFSGTKKRFLPYLSFALNWYFGQANVTGYHVVNIALHYLTAVLLCLTISLLFQTPLLERLYRQDRIIKGGADDVFFIAFFSAALWAVNPIQTQAVTYIVQRMAEMAAFFYLAGLFFYLKARLAVGYRRMLFFLAMITSFFFAVLSKENAVMLPVSLAVLELIFFSRPHRLKQRRFIFIWGGLAGLLAIFCLAIIVFKDISVSSVLSGYQKRPFTLMERMLTEPRIVLFYLSLIFYPLPARLSVAHDVALSTSFFSPWTTSVAIIIIITLVVLSWRFRHRTPFLSFALLFFFFNHIVESTIIPLELVFEHRNYLPSLFLFLPVVAGVKQLADDYMRKNSVLAVLMLLCLPLVVVGFGRFTYERNMVWKNSQTLWLDALSKTRHDARSASSTAINLAWGKDATAATTSVALQLLHIALQQNLHTVFSAADTIYGNIGAIYSNAGDYDRSVQYYKKGLEINPDFVKNRYSMIKSLVFLERWDEALQEARKLVDTPEKVRNPDYYNLYGFILLWKDQPAEALYWFQQALAIDPYNFPNILLNTGYALSLNGYYKRAEWFYKYWFYKGRKRYPPEIIPYFLLIENSIRAGNREQALIYARNLLAVFDVVSVLKQLKAVDTQHETVPMEKVLIAPVVKSAFYSFGEEASLKNIF